MALLIGDNFSYNGKKPNFERDSFETLAALKSFAEANIDNGHIAYCVETKKHYTFNDTNTIDESTGKWRELESEFSISVDLDDYLTKEEAQSTYQPVGDYALKSEIPDISNLALKSEIPTKVSELENDSNFLTSIPEEYVTDTELQEAISGVQFELPIASDSVLGGIKIGAGLAINPNTGVLSVTGGGTADAVDWANVTSKPQINGHDLISGNNTLASLGIQPEGDYALKSEIPSLNGYATENWVSSQGYLTSIPSEYITEDELNSKGYLTSVPDNYVTDNELTEAINDAKYTLPIASTDTLGGIKIGAGLTINSETGVLSATGGGVADSVDWPNITSKPTWITENKPTYNFNEIEGTISTDSLPIATSDSVGVIKVGAGLSITADGILSATGGGTADSVNWENVIGRPTSLSQFTNDSGFITNDDLPDLSGYALKSELPDLTNYALKSEIPTVPTNVSSFTNDSGYITSSALTDYAKKSEIPDISNLATKSELSNYAPVEHTHVVADITDFPEIPDVSNLATKTELAAKQDTLVSGTNIKTINGTSLLGSGNITIESSGGGSEITDVLDDKKYARTQGSWVDLTDWLAWAELD